MRAFSLFLSAAALLATTGLVQAETGAIAAQRATVQQMADATGSYQLSDGRRADVFIAGLRLYARIGNAPQKEIVLAGSNRFATRDGSISIQFGADPSIETIVLTQDRSIAPAQDRIRLASNNRTGRGGID